MWLTPWRSSSSSARSASSWLARARAAAPNSVTVLAWPVRPNGRRSIMRVRYSSRRTRDERTGRGAGTLLALEGALERRAALSHRPLRRRQPALRADGAGRRPEQDRQRGERGRRDPRGAARPPRLARVGLLAQPPGRGGRRRAPRLRPAGVRRARGQVHHAVLADVRRGGPEAARRAATDGGAGRGARPAGTPVRGDVADDGAAARRHAAAEQSRDLPRAHGL